MPRRTLFAALAFGLAACGATEAAEPDPTVPSTPAPTIPGVGSLPDTVPRETVPLVVVTRPVDDKGVIVELIGDQVGGNRLLVIGDSIMAGTASRYGREMCDELVPLGWTVEVDAEPGRFVEFGQRVLDRRLPDERGSEDDWDAAVVHLGTNYDQDVENYEKELREILFRLAPRPTLLFTVTEYRPSWSEVNDVIRDMDELFENVTIVDWERVARTPGVLSSDGLHPTNDGEVVLVQLTAAALGPYFGEEGECLRTQFTDDSDIGVGDGPTGRSSSGRRSSTGGGRSSSSTGGSSSGSSGGTGSTTSGTDSGGTDSGGDDSGGTSGTDSGGTDSGGTDSGGVDSGGTSGTDAGGSDSGGSDSGGTDSGTTGGTDSGGSDSGGSDSGGATTGGTTTGGGGTTGGSTTGGSSSGGSSGGGSTGGTTSGGTSGGSDTGGSATGTDSGVGSTT